VVKRKLRFNNTIDWNGAATNENLRFFNLCGLNSLLNGLLSWSNDTNAIIDPDMSTDVSNILGDVRSGHEFLVKLGVSKLICKSFGISRLPRSQEFDGRNEISTVWDRVQLFNVPSVTVSCKCGFVKIFKAIHLEMDGSNISKLQDSVEAKILKFVVCPCSSNCKENCKDLKNTISLAKTIAIETFSKDKKKCSLDLIPTFLRLEKSSYELKFIIELRDVSGGHFVCLSKNKISDVFREIDDTKTSQPKQKNDILIHPALLIYSIY
jgi:hypothetical protein